MFFVAKFWVLLNSHKPVEQDKCIELILKIKQEQQSNLLAFAWLWLTAPCSDVAHQNLLFSNQHPTPQVHNSTLEMPIHLSRSKMTKSWTLSIQVSFKCVKNE